MSELKNSRSLNQWKSTKRIDPTKSIEREAPIESFKYSQGAGENAHVEKFHVSPQKLMKISSLSGMEKMFAISTLDSLDKKTRTRIENLISVEPNDKNCICKICTCGFHQCPCRHVRYKFPSGMRTTYGTDFKGKPTCPVHGFDHDKGKPPFFDPSRVNVIPTYRHDYPGHPVDFIEKEPVKPSLSKIPFIFNTTYNKEFPNWGTLGKNLSKKLHSPYRPLPFQGITNYQENYIPPDLSFKAKPLPKKDNFPMEQPFNGNTTYRREYINHNVPKPLKNLPRDPPISTKAFPDQFRSIMKKDFTPKEKDICPVYKYEGVHDILARSSLYYNPMRSQYYF